MNRVFGLNWDGSRNYDFLKHFDSFSLHEAAMYWNDLFPGTDDEHEDHHIPSTRSRGLMERVLDGRLKATIEYRMGPNGERELDWDKTRLTRPVLVAYAQETGDVPAFLREDICKLEAAKQRAEHQPEVDAHTTELMELQKKAIKHFFTSFNASKSKPTREQIKQWLLQNGCRSQASAEAIVTVIMPDELKKGGRRKTQGIVP